MKKAQKLTLANHIEIANEVHLAKVHCYDVFITLRKHYDKTSVALNQAYSLLPGTLNGLWYKLTEALDTDLNKILRTLSDKRCVEYRDIYHTNYTEPKVDPPNLIGMFVTPPKKVKPTTEEHVVIAEKVHNAKRYCFRVLRTLQKYYPESAPVISVAYKLVPGFLTNESIWYKLVEELSRNYVGTLSMDEITSTCNDLYYTDYTK